MAKLDFDTYGKTKVRLMQVKRQPQGHEVREWSVNILLEGDFAAAYSKGDNSSVLPTDTMKNAVYVLARQKGTQILEEFASALADHFLACLSHVRKVSLALEEVQWERIASCTTAFAHKGNERRTVSLIQSRSGRELFSGLTGLQILKTADSAFSGFLKDELTTLPETEDRLFGTVLEAQWTYAAEGADFDALHRTVRETLLDCFAKHQSASVQHTLFAMGQAVLDRISSVQNIHIVMPNKHCLLVDLKRFGLDNANEIFVPTDEPSGYIEARLSR